MSDFEVCAIGTQAELVRLREEVTALRLANRTLRAALALAKEGFELELPGQWPARLDALASAPAPLPVDPEADARIEALIARQPRKPVKP